MLLCEVYDHVQCPECPFYRQDVGCPDFADEAEVTEELDEMKNRIIDILGYV